MALPPQWDGHNIGVIAEHGAFSPSPIIEQFCLGHTCSYFNPQWESPHAMKCCIDGVTTVLYIDDIETKRQDLWYRTHWYQGQEGFMLVFQFASQSSFDDLRQIPAIIRAVKGGDTWPIILVGLRMQPFEGVEVAEDAARIWAAELGCPFFDVNFNDRSAVSEAFHTLGREVRRHKLNAERLKFQKLEAERVEAKRLEEEDETKRKSQTIYWKLKHRITDGVIKFKGR